MTKGGRRDSSGKVVALRGDRNQAMAQRRLHAQMAAQLGSQVGPMGWQILRDVAAPEGAARAAENDRCQVIVHEVPSPMGPPDQVAPMLHLAIAERGRPLVWEEVMQVVREVGGFEAEGIELFPALRRELRGERYRHLYVLQEGEWPVGMIPPHEARKRAAQEEMAGQVSDMLRTHKVLLRVDEATQHAYVYRDAADAAAAQLEATTLREALAVAIPVEDEKVTWSPAAVAYREEVMAAAEALKNQLLAAYKAAQEAERAQPVPIAPPTEAEQRQAAIDEAQAAEELRVMREGLVKN